MRRGDIVFADLSPVVGSEIDKKRPVLIVSNDANNHSASTVTVLPITSNVARTYPFEVLLPEGCCGLTKASKAQAQQIRTIAKERLRGKVVGHLDEAFLRQVEDAIRLHLSIR